MSLAPVGRLNITEIRWLGKHRCKHRHSYLEHYTCYTEENPLKQSLAYFDIETTNLAADYGIVLCYCILDNETGKITQRVINRAELEKSLDREVIKQCIEDLFKYDKVVTYYGTKFDLPFIRSRALYWKLDFPEFGQLMHEDVYYTIKHKFRLSRNRMENACRTLLGKTEKTHIDANYWIRALRGDKKSLEWILDHCQRDVRDLQNLYKNVCHFTKKNNKSI